MKNRFAIINFCLMIAVLFSMLFQSLHSYEHLIAKFSEQKCHQKHITFGTQVSHEHNTFDHCFACEFTFSSGLTPDVFSIKIIPAFVAIPYFFTPPEFILSFSENANFLRGPPSFIV